jgi:hypothetical protein
VKQETKQTILQRINRGCCKKCKLKSHLHFLFLLGKQTRHRKVESSSITLSACPHLEESRDCHVTSCFSWKLAHKDQCFLNKGRTCGMGARKLFFNCVDHQGVSSFKSLMPNFYWKTGKENEGRT